jgi:hypothetical protein
MQGQFTQNGKTAAKKAAPKQIHQAQANQNNPHQIFQEVIVEDEDENFHEHHHGGG